MFERDNEIKALSNKIDVFENKLNEKESILEDLKVKVKEYNTNVNKNILQNEKNQLKKKNILERLKDIEKISVEKDEKINFLTRKYENLEKAIKQNLKNLAKLGLILSLKIQLLL